MKIFETKYRICTDAYAGYEVQHKYWFWPFWIQSGFSNTHLTLESAEQYAEGLRNRVVKEL